jgi:hypothetical protein
MAFTTKVIILVALCGACAARGDMISIGVFSFNNLNPAAGGSPGINDFEIDNFTSLLFGLPPDFPVVDLLTLTGVRISLFGSGGGSPQVFRLGDLTPGLYTPTGLQFLDTSQFASATLQATISQTTFSLSDGTTFLADSSTISSTILPSSGSVLQPGQDFAILSVSGSLNSIPEPRYSVLVLGILVVGLITIQLRRRPKPLLDD